MQPENPKNIPEKFLKPYNPQETESKIYQTWLDSGFFNPDICIEKGATKAKAETFSIVLPPPNVTGTLHIGHASMLAIEDSIVRFERMRGKRTLWIPGTDHAAIATQSRVEKDLAKEKIRKQDLGRDEFLKRVEKFAADSHDTIVNQIKKMGASVDWSREAYTLDEKRSLAVRTAFKKMYDDGLIYRGKRIVNWDPKGQTTISDDEIVYKEEKTVFYQFKYGPFVIATARPETKFGDKYVVMHPDDQRYAAYKDGQQIQLEWINGPITATIIKDKAIDMNFGTGVMTITPWHDATDFDIAQRHNLDMEQIIDQFGKLLPVAGEFAGMKIAEARPKIVEKLRTKGLLVKEEAYTHNIATAERTEAPIEPQIMQQWFVAVNKEFRQGLRKTTLKKKMAEVVKNGKIKIIPERFEKIYFNWVDNLRDWCISRQIWFGHRIPVWYRRDEIYCGIDAPTGDGWTQDPDTLDTWFSSGLWTFSTLGWPEKTKDLATYHPTNLLETGYDIIFFWVARMILMSTYLLNDIPFKTVYLHGLVRDAQGRKMSKSLGNIIDPVDMINKYGADAVRLSLLIGTGPGNDSKLSEDKIRAYKNYANKIWNASRFVLENTQHVSLAKKPKLSAENEANIQEFDATLKEITGGIENYRLYLAAEKLYHYFWHTFADKIIEASKKDPSESARWTLAYILVNSLKALHPFMPFVTEEIWQNLPAHLKPTSNSPLLIQTWPLL